MEKEEQTEENKSYLLQLANLCHCMMFLHSGFPELYGPVLESLKVSKAFYCIAVALFLPGLNSTRKLFLNRNFILHLAKLGPFTK